MPSYLFKDPDSEETKEVILGINEPKRYIDNQGKIWDRIFTIPQTATDTKPDPFSSKDFVKQTHGKKGTLKDLWDRSGETSEKRKEIVGGLDPIKQKYWDDWSKKRNGRKNPKAIQEGYHKD
ncbi:MAG: hypothetical protein AABY22_26980 [Nanoarchaeota archaeon]